MKISITTDQGELLAQLAPENEDSLCFSDQEVLQMLQAGKSVEGIANTVHWTLIEEVQACIHVLKARAEKGLL